MEQWNCGNVTMQQCKKCNNGTMEKRSNGTMEQWNRSNVTM